MSEVEPNAVIRDYIQNGGSASWKHKELVAELHDIAGVMSRAFFSPKTDDDLVLPTPLLAVAPYDKRVLGWFKLRENSLGLKFEIGLNEVWIDRPKWELAETICHEQVHLYDQEVMDYHAKTGYHRQEFVSVAEEIGLHPKLGEGWHTRPADGQFARLMERLGIERPESAKGLPTGSDGGVILPPGTRNWFDWDRGRATGGRVKGKSTLRKFVCQCEPPQAARIGKDIFIASCGICKEPFVRQD